MTSPTISDADALAASAHAGQVDKAGNPYIDHPRAVGYDGCIWPHQDGLAWLHPRRGVTV
jgi:hypothetical protein